MIILENAVSVLDEAPMASYYLGNFYYDKREYEKAILNWERCADEKPDFALSYRNLSIAYFNKRKDIPKAKSLIEKAFSLEKDNSRLLLEQDQLYKKAGAAVKKGFLFLKITVSFWTAEMYCFFRISLFLTKTAIMKKR